MIVFSWLMCFMFWFFFKPKVWESTHQLKYVYSYIHVQTFHTCHPPPEPVQFFNVSPTCLSFSLVQSQIKKNRKGNVALTEGYINKWPLRDMMGRRHLWIRPSGNSFINHAPDRWRQGNRGCPVLRTNKQHNRFFLIPSLTCCIFDPVCL